ncbi:MAG: 2,5-diamino-6-(ribosylamino)-4(3H)-pyrimidinone 5'-phosphate reductase [Chloroflexi bacterium]|nr:2,5-diamino-6-(ribosylamino)-4(3H)-pyrimidinone 5'-phosphate reductase [Chloroflexota bacterium]
MKPFVFINVAVTADGKMDTFERKGAGISSATDKARVLRLRAESDAVMVGGHTLLDEDPKLTVKTAQLREERIVRGMTENPIKVGVVTQANLKVDGDFMTSGPARRIIFTTSQTSAEQISVLSEHGAEVYVLGEKRVNLNLALETLYSLGVRHLMVEGGGSLNFELLRKGLVDELYVYLAPKIFGGQTTPTLAAGKGLPESAALHLKLMDAQVLDDDGGVLIRYNLML